MSAEEDQLIAAVCESGDKVAFAKLYDLCSPRAHGLALKILRNTAEAEDVLQQSFLSLWQHALKFKPEKGSLMTWLYTFIRNRSIDLLRKKKRENQVSMNQDDESPFVCGLAEDALRPDEHFDFKERQSSVSDALKALPEFQRRVIEAAYFEGLTQQEISEKFSEPLGTIKTRMRLGMLKLVELLKAEPRVHYES